MCMIVCSKKKDRNKVSTSMFCDDVQNPYVLSADSCGSSSGSAISVAANLVAVSLGSETDGSIICPSSSQLWALNQQLVSEAALGSSQSLLGRTLLGNFFTIFYIKIDFFSFAYWDHCTYSQINKEFVVAVKISLLVKEKLKF